MKITVATVHSTDGTQTHQCFYAGRIDRDDMLRKAFDFIWKVTGQTSHTDFDAFAAAWDWDGAKVEEQVVDHPPEGKIPHWGGLYK